MPEDSAGKTLVILTILDSSQKYPVQYTDKFLVPDGSDILQECRNFCQKCEQYTGEGPNPLGEHHDLATALLEHLFTVFHSEPAKEVAEVFDINRY